jgi:hypothetical protein
MTRPLVTTIQIPMEQVSVHILVVQMALLAIMILVQVVMMEVVIGGVTIYMQEIITMVVMHAGM